MKYEVVTVNDDNDEIKIEIIESDKMELIDFINEYWEMDESELIDDERIDSDEWKNGGVFERKDDKIIFITDVGEVIFSKV